MTLSKVKPQVVTSPPPQHCGYRPQSGHPQNTEDLIRLQYEKGPTTNIRIPCVTILHRRVEPLRLAAEGPDHPDILGKTFGYYEPSYEVPTELIIRTPYTEKLTENLRAGPAETPGRAPFRLARRAQCKQDKTRLEAQISDRPEDRTALSSVFENL